MPAEPRVSVVVLTHNRADELEHCLRRLTALPERPPIVVVDNASFDRTPELVRERFSRLELVRCPVNLGAAGRNLGVQRVRTPYVAFCDDDTFWAPGSLARAAAVLDTYPRLAAISARVLVGEAQRVDPVCERMAQSPLDSQGLPGPALIAFMAGAAVMRTQAYREVGGYEPRLFLGAEELLMGLDLSTLGWRMAYVPEVITHHHASPRRNLVARRVMLCRNRLWIALLRLPWPQAWAAAVAVLRSQRAQGLFWATLRSALPGLAWALQQRRPVPEAVAQMHRLVFDACPAGRPATRWRVRA